MTTDASDWKALGDLLVIRRVQLHPQYKNRRRFVADTHGGGSEASWYRMITSIETGGRDNYSRETLAAMEVAYELEPGSLRRSLTTGVLEPRKQPALAGQSGGALGGPESPPDAARQLVQDLRAQAEAADKTIGDVLVERGLATPDELTLSEQKQGDRYVKEILDSDLSQEAKNAILMDYVVSRRRAYRDQGLIPEVNEK